MAFRPSPFAHNFYPAPRALRNSGRTAAATAKGSCMGLLWISRSPTKAQPCG